MDSFFGLFGPSEEQGKSTSKGRHRPGEHAPDSLRNKPDFAAPEVDDSEESSFLCQPQQAGGVMLGGSYIEHHLELNVGEPREVDRRPTRWSSGRKSRRKKNKSSPPKELLHWPGDEPCQPPAEPRPLNNHRPSARTNKSQANVGKNVNNLHQGGGGDADHSRRGQPFEPAAYCGHGSGSDEVHSVIDKLEKVSLKDDVYTRGEFNTEDLGDDPYCSDPYEDSNSEAEDAGTGDETYGSLPPEPRYGNVEYKLQLVCPCERRFQHLITQLKWRLRSGGGAAIYLVGVRDCGALRGLRPRALRSSLRTLRRMAAALNAHLAHVTARRVAPHRAVAEVYIRKLEQQQSVELRVAVMGANEAGKSTLIGVLTQGELDNGTGSARLNMFRHVHEVRSGRTSSLSHEILGFDAQGNVVNYGCSELMTAERIGERSAKLVSFLDLAGHSKYQRTTVHGLTGYSPHHALLVVSATAGITKITEEHLDLLLALDLPFSIVISKCELEPYGALLRELADILRGSNSNKKPLLITDENMARNCVGPQKLILDTVDLGAEPAEPSQDCTDESEMEQVPVFPVSCVKGIGLNALHAYLLAVAPPIVDIQPQPEEEACEFQIDEIFHVGDAGPVVGGLLARGRLYEGDNLLIGPLDTGEFVEIAVITIYRNRVPCDMVRAGQSASLGLSHYPPSLRQGMVLLAVPEAYDRHPPQRRTFGGCSGQCRAAPADTKQRRTKNHRRRDNLLRDIQLAKDNLLKLPTGVDGNIYKQEDTEKVDNHMYQPKDIDNVDTFKQADKENRNIVDYAETEKMDCDIVKQTETELDNNDFNREDIDVNKNTTKEDCTCGDLVYLDDPNDPRGCLYFQATVRLLRHSTGDIHPGFQCTVHVGNVRQTAIIEGILSASGTLSVGARASVVFRFARCPEYVRARRRLLLRAGRETTAVGRLVQVFPHIPSTSAHH